MNPPTDLVGQIGLVRNGDAFIPRMIEWFTHSHSYHVVVVWSPTECVSAEPGGVMDRTNAAYDNLTFSHFTLTDEQRAGIVAGCKSSEKLPYNYAVYPSLIISRLAHRPVPRIVATWLEHRRNVDCSQLAAQIYTAAGIPLFTEESDVVTPGDWERLFRANGWIQ